MHWHENLVISMFRKNFDFMNISMLDTSLSWTHFEGNKCVDHGEVSLYLIFNYIVLILDEEIYVVFLSKIIINQKQIY